MLTLQTIPPPNIITYVVPINFATLTTATTTGSSFLFGMTPNYVVCGASLRVTQQFSGPGLSSLTCSLGAFPADSSLTDLTFYMAAMELTQAATPQAYELSGYTYGTNINLATAPVTPIVSLYVNTVHDIAAYFSAQGCNLNVLSSGELEVTIHIRPL